jgi:hypothetical protein
MNIPAACVRRTTNTQKYTTSEWTVRYQDRVYQQAGIKLTTKSSVTSTASAFTTLSGCKMSVRKCGKHLKIARVNLQVQRAKEAYNVG